MMASVFIARRLRRRRTFPFDCRLSSFLCIAGLLITARPTAAAELEARTLAAYERQLTAVSEAFKKQMGSTSFLETAGPDALARMRKGEILLAPGTGDGITDVPNGLVHHWRAAGFIPNITLDRLLTVAQDYSAYADLYSWVTASQLVDRQGDRFRSFFRVKRRSGVVTGVLDVWMVTDYRRIESDRASSTAAAECIRQVVHAGEPGEKRLRPGTGSGYIWRADSLSKYLARDGGVYVELDALGLSRGYPPLLGWVVEPVARRLGRDSAAESITQLRTAAINPPTPPARSDGDRLISSAAWCGEGS